VATSIQVPRALEAAERLAREDGIDVEVVDVRTLEPLDRDTIVGSVRRTGRAVVTDESFDHCGVASGLAAVVGEACFDALRAPVRRVAVPSVPVPYAESLERALIPDAGRIAAACRTACGRNGRVD
jgi:pyruvate/2-oxoglutarate/acetoin dehydrogenase E1 component